MNQQQSVHPTERAGEAVQRPADAELLIALRRIAMGLAPDGSTIFTAEHARRIASSAIRAYAAQRS